MVDSAFHIIRSLKVPAFLKCIPQAFFLCIKTRNVEFTSPPIFLTPHRRGEPSLQTS